MLGLAVVNDRATRGGIESLQREASGAQRYLERSLANAEAAKAMGMVPALLERWTAMNLRVRELQHATAGRSVALAALIRMYRQARCRWASSRSAPTW